MIWRPDSRRHSVPLRLRLAPGLPRSRQADHTPRIAKNQTRRESNRDAEQCASCHDRQPGIPSGPVSRLVEPPVPFAAQVAQSLCNASARLPASLIRPGRPPGCASPLLPGPTALSCLGDTAGAIRADRKPSSLQNSDRAWNSTAWRRKPPRPSPACDDPVFRRERRESPRMAGLRVRIDRPTRLRQDVSRYVCARPVPAPWPARIPGVNQPWATRRRQPRSLHRAAPRQTRPPQSFRRCPCRPPRKAGPGLVAALNPAAGNLAEPERYDDMLHGCRYDRKPDIDTPRPRAAVCAGPGRRGRKVRIWRANRKVGILRKGVLAATAAAAAAFIRLLKNHPGHLQRGFGEQAAAPGSCVAFPRETLN